MSVEPTAHFTFKAEVVYDPDFATPFKWNAPEYRPASMRERIGWRVFWLLDRMHYRLEEWLEAAQERRRIPEEPV